MEVLWKTRQVLQEWDAFCAKLATDIRRYDAGEKFLEGQDADDDYSKLLDLYLRLTFEPPTDGMPPDIFADTPPVLEKLLRSRISDADVLLQGILQKYGGLKLPVDSDPAAAFHRFFQKLLLPSPPRPGDYTWEKTV